MSLTMTETGSTRKHRRRPVAAEYKVNVTTSDLRIRKGPGTTFDYWKKDGKPVYTGKGAFTIVEEAEGPGASKGLIKSLRPQAVTVGFPLTTQRKRKT